VAAGAAAAKTRPEKLEACSRRRGYSSRFGLRLGAGGKYGSAGRCHQGFFTSRENLRAWVEERPSAIGRQITIDQSLADKRRMIPLPSAKACKEGDWAPK
jgi:hypothetical protein